MTTRKHITKEIQKFCDIINRRDRNEELSYKRRRRRFHANKKKFDFTDKMLRHIYVNILRLERRDLFRGDN